MDKKLPRIFKNTNISNEGNNKEVFYSFLTERGNYERSDNNSESYVNKIDYIFNTLVEIRTYSDTYTTKIVSKVGDHILTSDNRTILLSEIKDIKIKDRI